MFFHRIAALLLIASQTTRAANETDKPCLGACDEAEGSCVFTFKVDLFASELGTYFDNYSHTSTAYEVIQEARNLLTLL